MAPLEPKPSDPFIPCCPSCSCSQNFYLKSFELNGQIHRINYALKVVATRLAFSQLSKLGLVIEAVRFHGVLGIQMLEFDTSMSLQVRRSNVWSILLQSRFENVDYYCDKFGHGSSFVRNLILLVIWANWNFCEIVFLGWNSPLKFIGKLCNSMNDSNDASMNTFNAFGP
ncbi:hypothetical protein Cgig2_025669 [Carnegiea gigantea]|uniref:Uncharacterized protein n=1 Tax=Carnegiea gigantea TaxID=171969 RepID=A0A9Q1JQD7_9CARY|nr:hypothetical protein Cgig2_025669 [Carnegiea gigantea]